MNDANPAVAPRIDVVSVSASADLATLLGEPLLASTKKVTPRPHATGIYMSDGRHSATSADDPLGTSAVEIDGGLTKLSLLLFYAASPTDLSVIQEG